MGRSFLVCFLVFLLTSCATSGRTKQQQGALLGAGGGAAIGWGIGELVSDKWWGAVASAAAGGAIGFILGNEVGKHLDQQEAALRNGLNKEIKEGEISIARSADREAMILSISSQVLFDTGSAEIKPIAYSQLNHMIKSWQTDQQVKVVITGHTDNVGRLAYNRDLSARRAEAVAVYILQRGIPFSYLYTRGAGELASIADNNSAEGRKLNRRVDIVFYPSNQEPPEVVPVVTTDTEPPRYPSSKENLAAKKNNEDWKTVDVYAFKNRERQQAILRQGEVKKVTAEEPISPIRPASDLLGHI
jgi:outer membrane protein OmpA-like peptidoglycan-associated protein